MKTTLREFWSHNPCGENTGLNKRGWEKLTTSLGTKDLVTEFSLMQILESNGLNDAVWALRCFDYIDYCLFLADVAESVLDILEERTGYKDNSVRRCICGIHLFHDGMITRDELKVLAHATYNAYDIYNIAYAYDTYDTYDTAAYDAYNLVYNLVYDAAYAAANDVGYGDGDWYDTYAADAARASKWQEIEALFIKHFGEK